MSNRQRICCLPGCGKPITSRAAAKYCSPACAQAARRQPPRLCQAAGCGRQLLVGQQVACSRRCSGNIVAQLRGQGATDAQIAQIRALWDVRPALSVAAIGAAVKPPLRKGQVSGITHKMDLAPRPSPIAGHVTGPRKVLQGSNPAPKPTATKPAPARAQRPATGPVMRRNPTFAGVPPDKWRLNPQPVRKPEPVAEPSYQRPPLGAWLLLACQAWCEECRRQPMRCEAAP